MNLVEKWMGHVILYGQNLSLTVCYKKTVKIREGCSTNHFRFLDDVIDFHLAIGLSISTPASQRKGDDTLEDRFVK